MRKVFLDRASHLRNDRAWLEQAKMDGLFLAFCDGSFAFSGSRPRFFSFREIEKITVEDPVFLGLTQANIPLFGARTDSLPRGLKK